MSSKNKSQLRIENNASFPNNNSQFITPELLRTFNENIIDSLVSNEDSGSLLETASFDNGTRDLTFTKADASTFDVNIPGSSVDTGSLLETASFDNGTRNMTFTKGDSSTFDVNIPDATVETGSLIKTASISDADITFTKGDGSTFDITVNNVSSSISSSHAEFADETDDVILNVKNTSGADIGKGLAVHATGVTGENVEIKLADSSVSGDMPAIGITRDAISNNASGVVIISGKVKGLDTSTDGLVAGAAVYVNGAGVLTSTKPTGSDLIQNIGICGKVDATDGEIIVMGSGRSNDLPNITQGYAWVGDSDGVPQAVSTASWDAQADLTSLNSFTASQETINGFYNSFTASNGNDSLNTFSSSIQSEVDNLISVTGSYATTGSNTFTGTQDFQNNISQSSGNIESAGTISSQGGHTINSQFPIFKANGDSSLGSIYAGFQIADAGSTANSSFAVTTFSGLDGSQPILEIVGPGTTRHFWSSATSPYSHFPQLSKFASGIEITGSLTASASISSSLDIQANQFIGGTLTASLQEGYAWVGDGTGTTTTVSTGSFGGSIDTGSLLVTSSATNNVITFTKGDGSTYTNTIDTGSGGGGSAFPFTGDAQITGSLGVSGSIVIEENTYPNNRLGFKSGSTEFVQMYIDTGSEFVPDAWVINHHTAGQILGIANSNGWIEVNTNLNMNNSSIIRGNLTVRQVDQETGYTATFDKVSVNTTLTLSPQDPLPTGAVGEMAASGSNLYFHNGTIWKEVSFV